MSADPLRGPAGLFNVSVAPRFLANSAGVGWQGSFFTSIVRAPAGAVDQVHQRYCLIRAISPIEVRQHRSTGWEPAGTGFSIWQPGDEQRGAWRRSGHSQFLFVAPEQFQRVTGESLSRLAGGGPLGLVQSRLMELIFSALEEDLAQGSPAGPLVGEGLIAALIVHLAAASPAPSATLHASARERVVAYIDANLAGPLTLAELATVAGVGVRQFSRAFRAGTGESPHQFLLARRVERAKGLIARTWPLAEVALHCGFADQSQFTRTFARLVGTTPARYRAMLRPHGSTSLDSSSAAAFDMTAPTSAL